MEEQEALKAAGDVIDRITDEGDLTYVTLRNGIKLKCKPVPPLYFQSIGAEFDKRRPQPPMAPSEEMGRDEPNPLDPDYLAALRAHNRTEELATQSVLLAMGTELVEVPDGMYPPEAPEWEEPFKDMAELSGIPWECAPDGKKRYLNWLRYYAVGDMTDIMNLSSVPLFLAGLTEGEVVKAMDSFRSYTQRHSDNGDTPPASIENGNTPNRAARRARPAA